jgi:hypothetical protein
VYYTEIALQFYAQIMRCKPLAMEKPEIFEEFIGMPYKSGKKK